jgi:hypothetical protein
MRWITRYCVGGGMAMALASVNGRAAALPDSLCAACVTTVGAGATLGALVSDFETVPYLQSRLGSPWFCYNDASGRADIGSRSDFTDITKGAKTDTSDFSIPPKLAINGNGRVGNGASIDFTMGHQYYEISGFLPLEPFAGIGLRLSNDEGATYDLATDSAKGIYFEYRLSGTGVAKVRFEARGYQADWPASLDSHRAWWNLSLPATGGAWKGAKVMFADLQLAQEAKDHLDSADQALNTKEMMYFQWSVSEAPGTSGSLSIDNVYLIGSKKITPLPTGIRKPERASLAGKADIRSSGRSLSIRMPPGVQGGRVSVRNLRGETLVEKSISSHEIELEVPEGRKGVAIVVVESNDAAGIGKTSSRLISLP